MDVTQWLRNLGLEHYAPGLIFRPGTSGGFDRVQGEVTMKLRICRLLAVVAFVCCVFAAAQALARSAYIGNGGSNDVS
jgi:hypothetical protein